eukprot:82974-Alexandrium_andersonii.AAC.1
MAPAAALPAGAAHKASGSADSPHPAAARPRRSETRATCEGRGCGLHRSTPRGTCIPTSVGPTPV